MAEWWTYTLGDFLMFAPRTYWRMVELHNAAWWPAQAAMVIAGTAAALALIRQQPARWAALLLSAVWFSVGAGFHAQRYAQINWAAEAFALAFVVEAAMWLAAAFCSGRGSAIAPPIGVARRRIALALLALSLAGYPLLSPLAGRPWTQAEVFGLMPDPTVLATLGMLLGWRLPLPRALRIGLWIVPLLWCAVAGATLLAMDEPAWPLLPLAGAIAGVVAGRPLQASGTNIQSSR